MTVDHFLPEQRVKGFQRCRAHHLDLADDFVVIKGNLGMTSTVKKRNAAIALFLKLSGLSHDDFVVYVMETS
jgi:hypothetical protein